MRLTLSTLAVLASLSPACAEERVWSGFDSTDGKVTNYKLTIRGPHSGTEAYVIAHQTGFTTCYILLDKILDTDA